MDKQFLDYYNQELSHLRGLAQEFADEFPKIASRLRLTEFDCEDPYVERLLEGFAFLTARVHKKLNDSFPRFTESILSTVFPVVWAPIPSMAIVQLTPDLSQNSLIHGDTIPANTSFRTKSLTDDQTPCEFRNAAETTLWPLEIVEAKYLTKDIGDYNLPQQVNANAGVYIRLRNQLKMPISKLSVDSLPIFLNMPDENATSLLEHIFTDNGGLVIRSPGNTDDQTVLSENAIQYTACNDTNSLLPNDGRRYRGYRLFLEYFTFPARFKFFELCNLQTGIQTCESQDIELFVILKKRNVNFAKVVDAQKLRLHCMPVINLFRKRSDRIIYDKSYEYHVIPDRTRPRDYEVYSVEAVSGFDSDNNEIFDVQRFYRLNDKTTKDRGNFFAAHRRPRLVPTNHNQRSSYVGTEVFISFTGPEFRDYSETLSQVGIEALCSNRDLPLLIDPKTPLTFSGVTGVKTAEFIVHPSHPHQSPAQDETAWTAISQLRLYYASLFDSDELDRQETIKNIIRLYCPPQCEFGRQQIEGITSVKASQVTRRLYGDGHIYFAQGMEVTFTFDEYAFAGMGCFLLGILLREFLCHYVTINSFVEVVLCTVQRGELIRWEPITGTRNVI